jgi:Zn2+/Cd2+-exporting ATPase
MDRDPHLAAVRIERGRQAIAAAANSSEAVGRLKPALQETMHSIQDTASWQHCGLLDRAEDCVQCGRAGDAVLQRKFVVEHAGDATTILRPDAEPGREKWHWQEVFWSKSLAPRSLVLQGDELDREWKEKLVAAILCGVLGLTAAMMSAGKASTVLYLLAYLTGSWFTFEEVWERLQKRTLDVHFLMLVVAFGSASIGAWGEGATLLFLFSFSSALEHYAAGRTQKEIRSLFKTAPKSAVCLEANGVERIRPVELIEPGTRLLIKPGEQFPVDAEVIKGLTAADESNLTGEATPVEKRIGDLVLAGTMNTWGRVEVLATRRVQESALQKIIRLIEEAQHLKAPAQRFTDRFSSHYTYAVLGLSVLMFFVWWQFLGCPPFRSSEEVRSAFYRTMTLLVVASPCALVLSIPSAILAAIAWGARRGLLFRGGAAVEKLADVDVVVLDKTGTLTTGELRVEQVESFPPGRETEVLQLAFSMERLSTHPLARAITRFGKQKGIQPMEVDRFESLTGLGLQGEINHQAAQLGRREWILSGTDSSNLGIAAPLTSPGLAEVWVRTEQVVGRVLLRDDIRPAARSVIDQLRQRHLRIIVLTGDRKATGEALKEKLGLEDVHTELHPHEKLQVIHSLSRSGHKVAMVGDGVNDAPSLAAAHVGVAMGARGSDAALEQAEVVLMHDRLDHFLTAFELSVRARRIIRQNLFVSLGTVGVLMLAALAGMIPLTVGVVGHEGSTVVVVLNSLRLLFGKSGSQETTSAKNDH